MHDALSMAHSRSAFWHMVESISSSDSAFSERNASWRSFDVLSSS